MRKNILVVARDPALGATIKCLLQSGDHEVLAVAESSAAARTSCADDRPDLAIIALDAFFENDGILAGETLNKELKVPIAYLTPCFSDELWVRMRDSNPVGYLLMPFDPGAFRSMVEIALQGQDQLNALRQRNQFMTRETHHLIKNSLQIISSMITSQETQEEAASRKWDGRARDWLAFRDRMRAVALVHELLGLSSFWQEVNFGEYARRLVHQLNTAYSGKGSEVEIVLSLEDIMIHAENAVSLGLLLSELITNALRHAFPPEKSGRLSVTLTRGKDDMIQLAIEDNGCGVPEDFSVRDASRTGLDLIWMLADQLGGSIQYRNATPGTICEVRMENRRRRLRE